MTEEVEESREQQRAPPGMDTGLVCLVLLARYLGLAADPEQLRHLFAAPGALFADTEILLAAKSLGLKAGRLASRVTMCTPRGPGRTRDRASAR